MTAARRDPVALLLVVLPLVGLAIAAYLLAVRLAGGLPACGPDGGCEIVQGSEYSEFLGLPVALYGVAYSAVVLGAGLRWLTASDRRALLVAYGLGLLGSLGVAYLTYLELFVIEAICAWCVAYGTTVVAGMVVAVLALRRSPA
jgi:uncharacterized membrane protein